MGRSKTTQAPPLAFLTLVSFHYAGHFPPLRPAMALTVFSGAVIWQVRDMIRKYLLLLAILAGPLNAAEPMSADAFDSYTLGKTLIYGQDGAAYGTEEYLENRQVRWSFLDGQCKDGFWYEEAGHICFLYEDNTAPQCWTFTQGAAGLIAQFKNETDVIELYEADNTDKPMLCLGPEVGV